jgi:UDP-glucose 4-epimerase
MSSASAYGAFPDNPEFITEDAPLRPRDYNYGIYKREVEGYYRSSPKRPDLKLVIFRMCTAVGPSYYKAGGVVSTVAKAPFMLDVKGGDGRVQFIHEEDVIALYDQVVRDDEVEDTFNLAPPSYATTRELGEAYGKKFIPMPLWLLRGIFWILWTLHIAALTPAIARLMACGIIVSPKKLMERYNYTFKYSTKEAFMDAVEKRRKNGTL